MTVTDLVDYGPAALSGAGVLGAAYGVVRLYQHLFRDGRNYWEQELANLRADRVEDRAQWEEDRERWRADMASIETRLAQCRDESALLLEEVSKLRGEVAGLKYQLAILRPHNPGV